jgi:hypothetical protein
VAPELANDPPVRRTYPTRRRSAWPLGVASLLAALLTVVALACVFVTAESASEQAVRVGVFATVEPALPACVPAPR